MAKLVFGPIVSDARNKQGGTVFTKTRFGAMSRRKVSPTQPRSTAQMGVRAGFTGLAKLWGGATMDDTKRAGWNALAANYPVKDIFGAAHTLTGLQMFIKLNRSLATLLLSPILSAPATLEAGYPGALTVVATVAGPNTLTVTPATALPAGQQVKLFGAAQVSAGRASIGNKYRFLKSTDAAAPWDLSPTYVAKFGALVATKKVPILVVYTNELTGAQGTPTTKLQVVT